MRQDRLIVLGCAPRSGSTWLQLLLYGTGQVATVNETRLFSGYLGHLDRQWDRHTALGADPERYRAIGLPPLITRKAFLRLCRGFARPVLKGIADTAPDRPFVLEKTPDNLIAFGLVRQLFPRARRVHLVRDPRAVIASTLAAREWASAWASEPVPVLVNNWKRDVTLGHKAARDAPRTSLELRYEDLRADPAAVLAGLCADLGIEASARAVADAVADCTLERLRAGLAAAPWPLKREPRNFFRQGRAGAWRTDLDRRTIALIDRMTVEQRGWYGYGDHRPGADDGPAARGGPDAGSGGGARNRSGERSGANPGKRPGNRPKKPPPQGNTAGS